MLSAGTVLPPRRGTRNCVEAKTQLDHVGTSVTGGLSKTPRREEHENAFVRRGGERMPPKRRASSKPPGKETKKRRGIAAGAVILGLSPPCPGCPYDGTRERKGIRPSGRPKFRARCSRCQREARTVKTALKPGCKKQRHKAEYQAHASRSTGGSSNIKNSASVATIAELLCEAVGGAATDHPHLWI